ncbi:unnamed protein product [Cunninghamella echinulata]
MFNPQHFQAAHYGEVSEEMLGYFKNVEEKLNNQDFEFAEDQRLFVDNVYSEVEGNELRLSTNYSCSLILEKLLKISDGFQLRVFTDKLAGCTVELFAHRFASHVCQTLLTLAADVVDQEVAQGGPTSAGDVNGENGELYSMEKLILNICEDIKPVVGGLISQQFASHVVRVLLFVLSGKRIDESGEDKGKLVRSKKSAHYKSENNNKVAGSNRQSRATLRVPASFKAMFKELTRALAIETDDSGIRPLAVHRVASPVIQLLLQLQENDEDGKQAQTVLLDRILWGIITDENNEQKKQDREAWFQTLIRDKVGSHLMEVIVKMAPDEVYDRIHQTYLKGKFEKFSLNPVSNFVIQHAITNVRTPQQLKSIVAELSNSFDKLIKNGKYGVIRSLIDASVKMDSSQKEIVDALTNGLGMADVKDRKEFVNCIIRMKSLQEWNDLPDEEKKNLRNFHLQGSLILQGIMKMPQEQNSVIINSFLSMNPDVTLRWCYTPMGSRAYEAIIASNEVNEKIKKKVLRNLMGNFASLAKDKFGSHIVEKCWSVATIEQKEKIAQELMKYEYDLSEHYLGKCILWTCNIDLYKRRREEWIEREEGMIRKKDMFKDILGDEIALPKKKRNRY